MDRKQFSTKLLNYLRASYPFLWITSHEEERVLKDVNEAIVAFKAFLGDVTPKLYIWDAVRGARIGNQNINKTTNPREIISFIEQNMEKRQIFVLHDFHPFLDQPIIIRNLRNIVPVLKNAGNTVIFISPITKIPLELEKAIQMMEYPLPDEAALIEKLGYIEASIASKYQLTDASVRYNAVESAKGLTDSEAENAFTLGVIENKGFEQGFAKTVFEEKLAQVKQNGFLTYLQPDITFSNLGGLLGIKKWIKLRAKAFSQEAIDYGLIRPKGIILNGPPGTAKTCLAKAISNELTFPLFQLDVGSLFGRLVGDTEKNIRTVLQIIDSIGRCCVLIDEIEKSLNKQATSGAGDSGTSSRFFATFLSWLSDHTSPAFVIGTSNNFTILPPELIRKGRFTELFWIDLPTLDELKDVVVVLLKRYKQDPKTFDINKLAEVSQGFTGAEVESCIQSAMFTSFSDNSRELRTKDVLKELTNSTPQSKINGVELQHMRDEAKGKLKIASDSGETIEITEKFRKVAV